MYYIIITIHIFLFKLNEFVVKYFIVYNILLYCIFNYFHTKHIIELKNEIEIKKSVYTKVG